MSKISKDRALAALVRTFFKYFLTGMMEGKDLNDAKAVKQTLLEYYEHVSRIYNQEAFYAIARPFYQAMVEEYKRHFLILLEGRLATSEEANQYTPCAEAGFIDEALAIDIINRMAQNAYSQARKLSKIPNS